MPRPHILITNDDGIHAPGIKHLWQALKAFAEISIVAPAKEQSGAGLAISPHHPLEIAQVAWPEEASAWSLTGTPADCVKFALSVCLKKQPDLIVSGINRGANHGRNVLYSGTCGGAIEGVLRGIPSIAFSSFDLKNTEYAAFEEYIPGIVNFVIEHPLPYGSLLNVNFPSTAGKTPSQYSLKLTRQGKEYWLEEPQQRDSGAYMLGAKLSKYDEHEESDATWLDRGYITATPIHVNELTDLHYLQDKKDLFSQNFCTRSLTSPASASS